jgi:putative peptide maturation system protein
MTQLLSDAAALLSSLVAVVDTDDALARLPSLRAAHPDVQIELLWQRDAVDDQPRYTLLLGQPAIGTISLAITPPSDIPFPLRGVQRWREAELLRVDGRAFWLHEGMIAMDAIWDDARVLDRIVELCLVRRHLERDPIEISDDELQRAIDEFRARRGLFTAEATEAWLSRHGLALDGLEGFVEQELASQRLRHQVAGADAEAAFQADPARFDELAVVAFPATTRADADRLAAEIRAGAPFFAVAEQHLADRAEARAARSIVFETVTRDALRPLDAVDLIAGAVVVAELHGAGPYVVQVRSVTAAIWTPATRDAVERHLFARWLGERRARAHIEWNWGRADRS